MARGKALGLAVAVLVGTVAPAAALSQAEQQAVLDAHKAHCAKVQSIELKVNCESFKDGEITDTDVYTLKLEAAPDRLGQTSR